MGIIWSNVLQEINISKSPSNGHLRIPSMSLLYCITQTHKCDNVGINAMNVRFSTLFGPYNVSTYEIKCQWLPENRVSRLQIKLV